ncbi:MAG: ubiquinone/menaquinone biosynthesis methyltransferase, partial [Chloroflexi bacterium]|nr:ubiquinone/menaquinone biosynthesis methyltransferase [Chloroflexota bacterium]
MTTPIRDIFTEVPRTYEFLNHSLTFGQDILWRKEVARIVAGGGGKLWLDACSGTGELTVHLSKRASPDAVIITADFSVPMMRKALSRPEAGRVSFTIADVTRLPFRNESFDAITLSFATRNIESAGNLDTCLAEFHRVLKPGGRFVMLETSQPKHRPVRWLFHLYVKMTVRPIGQLVSGSSRAYAYLSQSMRAFHSPEELAEIIRTAGFLEVTF